MQVELPRGNACAPKPRLRKVVVIGIESVGKSSLLSALTGRFAESSALVGTTLRCASYADAEWEWIDTPGILTGSDAVTVKDTLTTLEAAESVLLVLRADRARYELASLHPLIGSRKVAITLTFRDRLALTKPEKVHKLLGSWIGKLGVPITLLDGRSPDAADLVKLRTTVKSAKPLMNFNPADLPEFPVIQEHPWRIILEQVVGFAPLSLLLLFSPAWVAVTQANALADRLYDSVHTSLEPLLGWLVTLPPPIAAALGGDYGVAAMFPFLLLYALPTILIFSGLISVYKSSGLIDHLSYALHRWLRPIGLGGRDLVRVAMGFGCNVPAIIATRSCTSCTRGTCISAISFGSACSYQLPATLAVFAAAGFMWLAPIYLATLAITTLVYLRLTTPSVLRQAQNKMLIPALGNLRLPDWKAVLRESVQILRDFAFMALPIFIVICVLAGLLQWSGTIAGTTFLLSPVMATFNLPPEAALAIVLGSVRKDGIAIGILNSDWDTLKVPLDTPIQILTSVYLAGVLLPCLVTVLTVTREMGYAFAIKMVGRQALFAVLFALCIAWFGSFLFPFKI